MSRKSTDPPRSPAIDAMQNLRPSGEHSFEELIARLFSQLSGVRIRICRAGTQGGVDAIAEAPFAIENKCYTKRLDARLLIGGLSYAADSHPDLELWILVATCTVPAQTAQELQTHGRTLGIAVLILDTTVCWPDVTSLAALAATDIDTTIGVLADHTWRAPGRNEPDLAAVKAELRAIRRRPDFETWEQRLCDEISNLPTWRCLVQSQNARLHQRIMKDAYNAFGTRFDASVAVSRNVESELDAWLHACVTTGTCDVAVVTGEGLGGKTWLVYQWLLRNLSKLEIPVFFLSSRRVLSVNGQIEELILKETEESLGSFRRNARQVVTRQRTRRDSTPWCIVILDGMNEYTADPLARADAVIWAVPPDTINAERVSLPEFDGAPRNRASALLVTCRTESFEQDSAWLGERARRCVRVEPYDAEEFGNAQERRSIAPEQLAQLPESAAEIIRQPYYLELTIRNSHVLGQFPAITKDVLHYLDASEKVATCGVRSDPDAFRAFLAELAANWFHTRRLDLVTLREQLRKVTDSVDLSVATLTSEGVITRRADGLFEPHPEKLALGMGLFIRERVLATAQEERTETLAGILEPHRDDDEKVRWLRAAVATSLLAGDEVTSPATLDLLVSAWLSSRNFSQADLEDAKTLSPLFTTSIIRLISSPACDSNVLLFAKAVIHDAAAQHPERIGSVIRQWFRLVPGDNPWNDDAPGFDAADVTVVESDPSLRNLGLLTTRKSEGRSVRERHRLGLSVLLDHPSFAGPIDLLALLAARSVTYWPLDDGERFAFRTLLANADREWFVREIHSASSPEQTRRMQFLRGLIEISKRADLEDLVPSSSDQTNGDKERPFAIADSQNAKDMLNASRRARGLALDPHTPSPPRKWSRKLSLTALDRFKGTARFYSSRTITKDGFDFEQIEPALAAWSPDTGARIARGFLGDIPGRIAASDESWSWMLDGHSALLTASDRRQLVEIVRTTPTENPQLRHALLRAYVCAMAEAPMPEALELLLSHPFETEWLNLYEVLTSRSDDALRRATLRVMSTERDPRRLTRARYLLANLGGFEASSRDLARLIGELSDFRSRDANTDAIHTLLTHTRVTTTTSAEALGPLVKTATSLAEEAWQYEAFLHIKRNPGLAGAQWVARARSAPLTARHNGVSNTVDDDVAVARGIENLAMRIAERLPSHPGRSEQFPDTIGAEIGASSFNSWVEQLLAFHRHPASIDHGLLIPVLRRALQTSHPAAKKLWELAYPFQRGRYDSGSRYVVEGLDWTLIDIHDPAMDDELACGILRELVGDCRSNSELISIAIGARLKSTWRLTRVVHEGLDSQLEVNRAKARFIAGWMPEDDDLRRRVVGSDPSRWVQAIGRGALARLDCERWAREWLHRCLTERRRERRWAAGRLFVACSDAATPYWADDVIYGARVSSSRRAQAALLVKKIGKKVDDSDLRDKFLGHSTRELSRVVRPWFRALQWDEIEVHQP